MKKILPSLICLLLLAFTGCSAGSAGRHREPNSVTIEGVTYLTGFYGDLSPQFGHVGQFGSETLQEEVLHDDNGKYNIRRVEFEGHNWVHSYMGGISGFVYCAEDEWEQMQNYYANLDNFDFYCGMGSSTMNEAVIIPDIDWEKFDELREFGNKHSGTNKFYVENRLKVTRRLPEEEYQNGVVFYKVSKDGYFSNGSGPTFFVHDGKLLVVTYHDGGRNNGGKKEVVVVDVPDELGQYFIDLMEQFPELRF